MRRRSMIGVAPYICGAESAARLPCRTLDSETEERSQPGADDAAAERRDQPQPAMQARRRDAAEIGADIAAIGEPCAVPEQQPAGHRGAQRAGRDAPTGV